MKTRIVRTKVLIPAMALLVGVLAGRGVSCAEDTTTSMRERMEVAYQMLQITQGRGSATANWQAAMSDRCIGGDSSSCTALRTYAERRREMLTGILMDKAADAVAPTAGPQAAMHGEASVE